MRYRKSRLAAATFALVAGASWGSDSVAPAPFRVQVVDDSTGRGVPLVVLETVNHIRWYTDSQGIAAIDESGVFGLEVFFLVASHGYEYPADGFGNRGAKLTPSPGGNAVLKIHRVNIAERLYRLTGAGIYRDSKLTRTPVPIREPILNGQVFGCDGTMTVHWRGKIHWFFGDTSRPAYPLGNFHVTGATSLLPADGGLEPAVGVDLEFFTGDDGFVRPMAKMPGEGATWISGLTVVPDDTGRERLFAGYVKVAPGFVVGEHGLAEFDDASGVFRGVAEFGRNPAAEPIGHPIRLRDGGTEYVYFGTTVPCIRAPARAEALARLESYEAFTCLRPGSRLDAPEIDRGPDGAVRHAWKRNTPAVDPRDQAKWIEKRLLADHEGLFQFRDRDSDRPIVAHFGSVYWNDYRTRFVAIFVEAGGESSHLGEVWYSEGDSPLGPWTYAVKIVTHDRYTFYNPKQHPLFAEHGGRVIYFDGTYSNEFSGNPVQTPRYDYNPMMYRLDLADPRLSLPVAIYRDGDAGGGISPRNAATADAAVERPDPMRVAFFAFDRPGPSLIPVRVSDRFTFYGLPADLDPAPPATVPLYEYAAADSGRRFDVDPTAVFPGFERSERPLCRVWRNPFMPR